MTTEQLRKFCLSLPHATEDVKWEESLCFCVGGKIFAATSLATGRGGRVSFKTTPEEFVNLTEREGVVPAPYLARYDWVHLEDPDALRAEELKKCIAASHALVLAKLPRKLRRELES